MRAANIRRLCTCLLLAQNGDDLLLAESTLSYPRSPLSWRTLILYWPVSGEQVNEMEGSVFLGVTEIDIELLTASRDGGVVGCLEIEIHQRQWRP